MPMHRGAFHLLSLIVAATMVSACGGGGSAGPPAPAAQPAAATPQPLPSSSPPVTAQSVAVNATAWVPSATVDPQDVHPADASASGVQPQFPGVARPGPVHMLPPLPGYGVAPKSADRRPAGSGGRAPRSVLDDPSDVAYYGGSVLGGTVSHLIYVSTNYQNCGTSCWGSPAQFLTDLGASNFISYLDQYIGLTSPNRYTKGTSATVSTFVVTPSPAQNPVISQTDIMGIIIVAAQALGTPFNYGHVYHVMIPPGTDTCVDLTGHCYSPDSRNSFYFCGYHSSVDFGNGIHVLYTVEPYQGASGCYTGIGLNNATANVLSHEMFETITDPDGAGWSRPSDGFEIGDICRFYLHTANLNGTNYILQSEYSNLNHACIGG